MKINTYPDKTTYINNTNFGEQVFRINFYEDLWYLNQFVDAFHSKFSINTGRIEPIIILPNLLDAQADRRFNKGESSGLKLVCKFLNSLEANFKIFHPHNPEVVEALMDNVEIIDNSEFIKEVLESIADEGRYTSKEHFYNNLLLLSSDAGGYKPLMKLCDKIGWQGETYSAAKSRQYTDGKSKLTQLINKEDFEGKDILIIDDISVYGGTFKGLSKLLKERNCGKLYLAVSHMTVQDLGDDPVTNYFDSVFCSNSKFNNYFSSPRKAKYGDGGHQPKNLEIIKLF